MLNAPISKLLTTRTLGMLALGALAMGGVASGQAQRPDATLDELVVEVQALRAEMNQAASASIRAQLLVGRLQMEDQRIAGVVRELDAVQAELAATAQVRADAATHPPAAPDPTMKVRERQSGAESGSLSAASDVYM